MPVHTCSNACQEKKKALWSLPNTEINRGNGDIWIFFMSLPQTLYDIKYVKQMSSYLTFPYGVLGALNYSGLWKKKWGLLRKSQNFWGRILNLIFRIKWLAQIPLHYKVSQRSSIHFCQQEDRIKVRLQKIHRDLIFASGLFPLLLLLY